MRWLAECGTPLQSSRPCVPASSPHRRASSQNRRSGGIAYAPHPRMPIRIARAILPCVIRNISAATTGRARTSPPPVRPARTRRRPPPFTGAPPRRTLPGTAGPFSRSKAKWQNAKPSSSQATPTPPDASPARSRTAPLQPPCGGCKVRVRSPGPTIPSTSRPSPAPPPQTGRAASSAPASRR